MMATDRRRVSLRAPPYVEQVLSPAGRVPSCARVLLRPKRIEPVGDFDQSGPGLKHMSGFSHSAILGGFRSQLSDIAKAQ
jgi:hypothetical protein